MPKYTYRAKNLAGKEETGVLEAENEHQLAKLLRSKGYFLISASGGTKEGKKNRRSFSLVKLFNRFIGISLSEKLFFTRNLEVMIKTGVPLPRAFRILALQAKAKKFKKVLQEISDRIIKGENLSAAIAAFPGVFSPLYQETLKVGEETGKLEDALRVLAKQMEREYSLKSKIKTAMVYPVTVLCMAFLIGVLMMIFAVPNLKNAFQELEIDLPLTTRVVFFSADFLINKWPLAVLLVGGLILAIILLLKTKKGGRIKSGFLLNIPLISKIVKQINSALVMRTLSSLLRAGVPIVRSLNIASGALGNFYFKKSLKEASIIVEKGQKVFEALKPYDKLYPPMVLQMLEIGEETGETSAILEKLADFYEREITSTLQKLSSIIEPFLILVIGGIVGFFAISMMQPMFSIMSGLQ